MKFAAKWIKCLKQTFLLNINLIINITFIIQKKNVIKTSTAVEFYKTHFNESLLIQKFEQKEFEIFEKKDYNNNNMFANSKSTDNSFENNDSDSQNISEIIKMSDNNENKNASNSIYIEKKKTDLLISMKSDLEVPKENDLQTPKRDDLQTEELSNSMKAPQNRADERGLQTASDFARKRIPKFQKHKTMAPTAASERPRKEKRAYAFKAFDKKKTSVAFTTKSADDKIVKSKIYHETIIGFDKKK